MFGLNRVINHSQPFLHSGGILVSCHARFFNSNSNYYEILGVSKDATEKEIKVAFLTLSKKWHPDVNKNPGATAKFVALRDAYSVLGSAKSRSDYDARLRSGAGPNPTGWSQTYGAHTQYAYSQQAFYRNAYSQQNAQYQSQHSWQGKGYWQWTPEEEAEFRKWFYENEGFGPRTGESFDERQKQYYSFNERTFWEKYKIIIGVFVFGVIFNIIRIAHFKYVYQNYQEKHDKDFVESERKYNDFKQRFNDAIKDLKEEEEEEEDDIEQFIERKSKKKKQKHALSGIIPTPMEDIERKRKELEDKWFETTQAPKKNSFMGIPTTKEITPLKKESPRQEKEEHVIDNAPVLDTKYAPRNYIPSKS